MRIGLGLATASMAAMLMVTASFAADETPQVGKAAEDPMEGINRITSGFNRVVRGAIVDPLVDGYQAVTPQFLQDAIGNAAANLNEPVTAVSSFLQGDTDNAEAATKRFFINSTLGLGGLEDKATEMGYESRQEDLGQAAGYHGTDAGTHIVLPLLGPSNTRDLVGDVLTGLASPVPLVGKIAQQGVTYSQNQDQLNGATEGALDPYVVERDAYEQHRQFLISNGELPGVTSTDLDVADFK
jgi:phospholipid-binding lipoprotein MlaA